MSLDFLGSVLVGMASPFFLGITRLQRLNPLSLVHHLSLIYRN
jgi:hypothetical protein